MRRFFSKFFGGKIKNFPEGLPQNNFFKKNGACVFWAPVFFLSLLAGKLIFFSRVTPQSKLRQSRHFQKNL